MTADASIKPSITEIESMMDKHGEGSFEIQPDGKFTKRTSPTEEPSLIVYRIIAGDRFAMIYWDGEFWTQHPRKAAVYHDWKEAKAKMSELRDSSGSTIRTSSDDFNKDNERAHEKQSKRSA